MDSPAAKWKRPVLAAWAALALGVTGCGGSLYVSWGGDDDDPPQVTLAVTPTSAAPGRVVRLVAAASDDYGVVRVQFFRVVDSGSVSLGSDGDEPYELDTTLPSDATGTVQFFARAVDQADQWRESNTVSVTVVP